MTHLLHLRWCAPSVPQDFSSWAPLQCVTVWRYLIPICRTCILGHPSTVYEILDAMVPLFQCWAWQQFMFVQAGQDLGRGHDHLLPADPGQVQVPVRVPHVRQVLVDHLTYRHGETWPAQVIVRGRLVLGVQDVLRGHGRGLRKRRQINVIHFVFEHQAADVEPSVRKEWSNVKIEIIIRIIMTMMIEMIMISWWWQYYQEY